jgi:hypothetical protein
VANTDTYLDLGFPDQADPDAKRERFITVLEDGIDGYAAADGNPEVIIGEGTAEMAADNELLAQQVAAAIFRAFGQNIIGLLPVNETAATALTTWTAVDTVGHTIPAGTQVAIGDVTFTVDADTTIPGGSSSVTGVSLTAAETGAATSGLTDTPALISQLAFVSAIALPTPTVGGQDAETDGDYQIRLVRKMRSFGRPTIAADFAERAEEVPEVAAALIIDGYDAVSTLTNQGRTVTIAVRDSSGGIVSSPSKTLVHDNIAAEREPGWNIYVIDPTYTVVLVAATVTVWDGYDKPTVELAAEAAVTAFLAPSSWGSPPDVVGPVWNLEPTVLRGEVTTVLNNVDGVRHVTALTLAPGLPVTGVAATDTLTSTAHGFANDTTVVFSDLTGGAPLVVGTTYYVRNTATNTFKVATAAGGTPIDITTDITAGHVGHLADQDVALTGVAPLPTVGLVEIEAA